MGPVLVLVERNARASAALLTAARRLGPVVALCCGRPDEVPVALLGRFGAATVFSADAPETADHRVEALVQLAGRVSPAGILIASGRAGQEIAARVAVRLDSGVVAAAVDLRAGPNGPVAVQSVLAGAYLAESSVVRGTPVITVRTEAIVPEAAPVDPAVHRVDLAFPDSVHRVSRRPAPARTDVRAAAVVVAGGRGVGSRAGFELVGRVAEALGGAVGGSHSATELGWCPRDARIGPVGAVVHPCLYLALGISGSARHQAGMQGAKTIVAIDRDPAAPIFGIADLGVVGDLHQVVPELLAEIQRRRAQPQVPEV